MSDYDTYHKKLVDWQLEEPKDVRGIEAWLQRKPTAPVENSYFFPFTEEDHRPPRVNAAGEYVDGEEFHADVDRRARNIAKEHCNQLARALTRVARQVDDEIVEALNELRAGLDEVRADVDAMQAEVDGLGMRMDQLEEALALERAAKLSVDGRIIQLEEALARRKRKRKSDKPLLRAPIACGDGEAEWAQNN